ncbi:MAG: hypothetical protein QOH96_1491, partial [Blastocatellia bacterium]|nr:hypothetical protein [Blastocatellia bacterium]
KKQRLFIAEETLPVVDVLWRFHQGPLTDRALDRYSISASFTPSLTRKVTTLFLPEQTSLLRIELKASRCSEVITRLLFDP